MNNIDWGQILTILLLVAAGAFVFALLLGLWVWRRVRRLRLPPGASFVDALRLTPLSVVILLDLLDMSLDIFSAPITWVILSRLGLYPLRVVSATVALIPGTQLIPTMTAAWLLMRLLGPRADTLARLDSGQR